MLRKDGPDVGLLVLAAKTKEHPHSHLADHELLQCAMGRSHHHPKGAILTTSAPPEGVITVEHDHFVRHSVPADESPKNAGAERCEASRGVGHMPQVIGVAVMELGGRVAGQDSLRTDHVYVRQLANALQQLDLARDKLLSEGSSEGLSASRGTEAQEGRVTSGLRERFQRFNELL